MEEYTMCKYVDDVGREREREMHYFRSNVLRCRTCTIKSLVEVDSTSDVLHVCIWFFFLTIRISRGRNRMTVSNLPRINLKRREDKSTERRNSWLMNNTEIVTRYESATSPFVSSFWSRRLLWRPTELHFLFSLSPSSLDHSSEIETEKFRGSCETSKTNENFLRPKIDQSNLFWGRSVQCLLFIN